MKTRWRDVYKFSRKEIEHLIISGVALAFAFSLILFRRQIFKTESIMDLFTHYQPIFLVYSLIAVGMAFILHELGHKFTAQKFGMWSEFRIWSSGITLAVAMAIFTKGSFVFAAPGATMISPMHKTKFGYSVTMIDKAQIGKIGIAGPAVNIVLGVIFASIALFTGWKIAIISAQVNAWLAAFNMIPFGMLDGAKVWKWDKKIWFGFLALILVLFSATMALGTL